jgi:hypothetical protein
MKVFKSTATSSNSSSTPSSSTPQHIIISQDTYIQDKLTQFGFDKCNVEITPEAEKARHKQKNTTLDSHSSSSAASSTPSSTSSPLLASQEQHTYQMMVGSLIYASISTRPDITHAVGIVARHMHNPSKENMTQVKRIFRYLSGTRSFGLTYMNHYHSDAIVINGYCDADWGGDLSDLKSTTGYCTFINDNLVSWQTKKQSTVALSAEAEYMAINDCAKEIMWMRMLLTELNITITTPTTIYVDNQPAIRISENDSDHDRTKHIDIKHYYIRDLINEGSIKLEWISTHNQLADIFTKALGKHIFTSLRDQLIRRS